MKNKNVLIGACLLSSASEIFGISTLEKCARKARLDLH